MALKDQLLKISELKLAERIDKMDADRYAEYCKVLDLFVEVYPNHEAELRTALKAKNLDHFCKTLDKVSSLLSLIYADDLSANCKRLSRDALTSKPEIIEAYSSYLLTAVSMLSIDIQMAKSDTLGTVPSVGQQAPVPEDNQTKSILAVDDVSLTLNALKLILKDTPYKLVCVASGTLALRYIMDHTPDLFILDIEMPEMNGYELAKKIRQKGQKAPIIFLTGNATQDYVLKAMESGAADFIVKPVNKEFVLSKIKKHLG